MRTLSLYAVIAVTIVGVYLVDAETALGFIPWLFYLVAIGLTYLIPHRSAPIVVGGICATLVFVGLLTSPPGAPERFALANRTIGAVVFMIAAVFLTRYKDVMDRLHAATEQLAAELRERTRDLGMAVRDLQREVDDRQRAEQGVRNAWAEVDRRVQERMHTLTEVSLSLREKIFDLEADESRRRAGRRIEMTETKADLERLEGELQRLKPPA